MLLVNQRKSVSVEELKKGTEEDGADRYEDEVQDEDLAGFSDSVSVCLTVVSFFCELFLC